MPTPPLTLIALQREAALYAAWQSKQKEASLFGVTDGKAVGTHVEHAFQERLRRRYTFPAGNAARGIDFPGLDVDLKVTSVRQPQSSCPFKDARQKIYGLGYSLLIFVYEKHDERRSRTARLDIQHAIFVAKECTGDFQTTSGLRRLLENQANRDDLLAYFAERMLPVSDILAESLADEILRKPPSLGYLTISNALQWRLQYSRVIKQAGLVDGIQKLGA